MPTLNPRFQKYMNDKLFRIELKWINHQIVEDQINAVLWKEGRPAQKASEKEREQLRQQEAFALETLRSEELIREVMRHAETAKAGPSAHAG